MMAREGSPQQFDREGIRRIIAQALSTDAPASPQEAERLIYGRFGPYGPEREMVRSAITAYFTGGN